MKNKLDWNLVNVIEEVVEDNAPSTVELAIDTVETYEKIENICEDCPEDNDIAIFANYLQDKGYGNVKQAVTEFAEKLKSLFCPECDYEGYDIKKMIDELKKELYVEEAK